MTLPTALPSSTATRHRTHTVLIDQYSFDMRSIGCSSTHLLLKLFLIYGSVFVSSSLRLPPSVHVNLPWCNLSPLSPSMHRSAVKPEAHIIHSTCRYFAEGGTNLVGIRLYGIQYTVVTANLARRAASVLRLCLRLPSLYYIIFFLLFFFSFFSLLLSRGLPPRMRIKLPWCHLSMAGGLAEGN